MNAFCRINKKVYEYISRRKLRNKKFTIISNNCWAGFVYRSLKLEYKTPFVGLFLYSPDYIKLLENLHYYLGCDLKFVRESKYDRVDNKQYPIGILDDIEIHFLHYKTEAEAYQKWMKRLKRVDYDNLFIKYSDRDLFTEEHLQRFENLAFENKVFFTARKYDHFDSTVHFSMFNNCESVDKEWDYYFKYFDIARWLNNRN